MTLVRTCVMPRCPGGEPEPDAHTCAACRVRLVRMLGDIEGYLDVVTPHRVKGAPGPRAKGYASTPPLNLDVVAMLDSRTELNGFGPDDVLDEIPNIQAEVVGWVRLFVEEYSDHPPLPGQLSGAVALLRSRADWLCRQPWVDELAAGMGRIHGALRRACKDDPPRPLGQCLDPACAGDVHRRSDDPTDARLRCARCRTTYSGLDLVKIGAQP